VHVRVVERARQGDGRDTGVQPRDHGRLVDGDRGSGARRCAAASSAALGPVRDRKAADETEPPANTARRRTSNRRSTRESSASRDATARVSPSPPAPRTPPNCERAS
jgi:hypothetical protein